MSSAAMRSDHSLSPNRLLSPPHTLWEVADGCTVCGCTCRTVSPHPGRLPMKRKLDFSDQSPDHASELQVLHLAAPPGDVLARVDAENECLALEETVASQSQTIQELYRDLEEERSASSSAACEAMSMILRLQREKAEVQMEARQYKQYAEEKMAHDQNEIGALEEVCYRREQTIQSLMCELQSYKHRMLSYGVDPNEDPAADGSSPREVKYEGDVQNTAESSTTENYPSLRCYAPNPDVYDDLVVKYAAGDTPRTPGSSTREHLHHIEQRIWQMERQKEAAVPTSSPIPSRLDRKMSCDSSSSFLTREIYQEHIHEHSINESRYHDAPPEISDLLSEDKMSSHYEVYTIDGMDRIAAPAPVRSHEDYYYPSSPSSAIKRDAGAGSERADIKKLYMRLQALEADRENLKQAIVSMRTDRAQMVMLKELAENLSKGVVLPPPAPTPMKALRRKPSLLGTFSFVSALKWIVSFQWFATIAFWKKKTKHSKYMLRLTNGKVGLVVVLDKALFTRHWRCLTRPVS